MNRKRISEQEGKKGRQKEVERRRKGKVRVNAEVETSETEYFQMKVLSVGVDTIYS